MTPVSRRHDYACDFLVHLNEHALTDAYRPNAAYSLHACSMTGLYRPVHVTKTTEL